MAEPKEVPVDIVGGFGLSRTQKDLLAGTVGGIAQVFVGQPFDIVKSRLQSAPPGSSASALSVARHILTHDGPTGFYKGTLPPLLGIGACVSVQFGVLEGVKRLLKERKGGAELGVAELFVAGASAGVANSFISAPVEHLRIRLQTQPSTIPLLYSGPGDALRKIYAQGGIAGVFKGQIATMWRDGVGYGSYFAAYEVLVQRHIRTYGVERKEISPLWAVTYGAAAGYALWFSIYPVDVLKTKLQTDTIVRSTRAYTSMIDCARKTWQRQGLAGFTNGLGPTLIRSPFANGATFLFFELTMRALE